MPFTSESARALNERRWPQRTKEEALAYLRGHSDLNEKGCWIFRAKHRGYNGYIQASFRGKVWRVHRYAYTVAKGPIPEGLFVCHSCDERACCNPDHLWVGTREENMQDSKRKGRHYLSAKPTCIRGHPLSGENLLKKGPKERACRTCVRALTRIKAGWPEHLAWSTPIVAGRRVWNGNWRRSPSAGSKP